MHIIELSYFADLGRYTVFIFELSLLTVASYYIIHGSKLCILIGEQHKMEIAALQSKLPIEAQPSSPSMSTGDPTPVSKTMLVSNTDIPTTVASLLAEEKEKDRRRLNLIVHQLMEPTETDAQKRKQRDLQETANVIQNYLGVLASMTNAVRLENKSSIATLIA